MLTGLMVTVLLMVEQKVEDGTLATSCEISIGRLKEFAVLRLISRVSYWLMGTSSWSRSKLIAINCFVLLVGIICLCSVFNFNIIVFESF